MNKETIKEMDRMWGKLVAYDFKYRCFMCGLPATDPHHWFIHRWDLRTRWERLNGVYLCRSCHTYAHGYKGKILERIKTNSKIRWDWMVAIREGEIKPSFSEEVGELLYNTMKIQLEILGIPI